MNVEERLARFLDQTPSIAEDAYVAPGATVMGAVTLGPRSSVWPNAVLRGDINTIRVGAGSNIQDGSIVHLADDFGVAIGDDVTVGHAAVVHACAIEDECLIGMQSTVLDGAVVGARSIVAAGALVAKGTEIPPGSLVVGSPAKVKRQLTEDEQAELKTWAEKYVVVAREHRKRRP